MLHKEGNRYKIQGRSYTLRTVTEVQDNKNFPIRHFAFFENRKGVKLLGTEFTITQPGQVSEVIFKSMVGVVHQTRIVPIYTKIS